VEEEEEEEEEEEVVVVGREEEDDDAYHALASGETARINASDEIGDASTISPQTADRSVSH
jgi:hypothetical protein